MNRIEVSMTRDDKVGGRKSLLLVGLSAIFACSLPLNACRAEEDDTWMWGTSATNPVPDGAKIRLETDRQEYFLGENILVHFVLENTGANTFEADFGGDYRGSSRSLRFKVTATNDAGAEVEDPDPDPECCGGTGGVRTLKPGERFIHSLPLMRYRQLTQPGRYTITATHDFGWKETDGRKRPIGVTTITLRMPDAAQAEKIVSQMESLPKDVGTSWGEKSKDYPDFSCLCQPVYLPTLERRVRSGNLAMLQGIGVITNREATQLLIELANAKDTNLALEAALTLNGRLPDPEFKKELSGRGPFRFDGLENRRRLAKKSWDESFAAPVRALALKLLARKETSEIDCGAFMIQAVGTSAEAPAVIATLSRVLDSLGGPRHDAKDNILNLPEPLPELIRAMKILHARGFNLDADGRGLSGNAQIMIWFDWLAEKPGPRPPRWLEMAEAFGTGSRYPLTETVVHSIPSPMPPECTKFVAGALSNTDYGVCYAACEVAGKSGRMEFIKPLLEIVATETHEWLFREAANAANELGSRFDLLETCADRLDNEQLFSVALDYLQTIFEGLPGGWSGRTDLSRTERLELRKQWKAFLATHEKELRAGKKIKLSDPIVPTALFGRARSFHLTNGAVWPKPEP